MENLWATVLAILIMAVGGFSAHMHYEWQEKTGEKKNFLFYFVNKCWKKIIKKEKS